MKRAILGSLFIIAVWVVVAHVRGEEVQVAGEGSVDASGYTLRKGFYWKDSVAYVRTQVQVPYTTYSSYYYCGRYYSTPSTSYKNEYKYTAVDIPKAGDPAYLEKLLNIYSVRAKYDADLVKSRVDTENFAAAVRVLGLEQNLFRYSGTIGSPYNGEPYPAQSVHYSSAGVNGKTIYGHSYQQLADIYGAADINILFQAAGRTTENAQTLAGQAHNNLTGTIERVNQGMARVAETQANSVAFAQMTAALAQAVRELKAAPSAHIQSQGTGFSISPKGYLVEPLPAPAVQQLTPAQFRQQACAACHSGERIEGGLDVTRFSEWTVAQKAKTLKRLTSGDMPRDMTDPSKPGVRLTPEQVQLFFQP